MASDSKKTKSEAAPVKTAEAASKNDATKAKSPATEEKSKDIAQDKAKDTTKSESSETPAAEPANYSRGEGQKPVTKAYRENWNAIFAKKTRKKRR